MSHNDTEIEIKIKIDGNVFSKVRKKLEQTAKFEKKVRQSDEYFTPAHRNFVEPKFPFEWMSIRKRGDKTILNYKHFIPEDAEVHTHCDEFETEIKNSEGLKKIFSAVNMKSLVTVDKEREVFIYNGEFEVALDIVKDLGYFIEIETMRDFGSVEEARKRLFELAKSLGVDTSNPDLRGYPYLMMEKKGLVRK